MRSAISAAVALGLTVAPVPIWAQDGAAKDTSAKAGKEPSEADVAAMMKAIFPVEPLTAEQQARLPRAQAVIARIMPPGTMQQMMGGMFDKMLNPLIAMGAKVDSATIATELSIEDEEFAIAEEDAARVGAILDPVREQRIRLVSDVTQRVMATAMKAMEPGMRKGLAEAYAVTFTSGELTAIAAFFATPEGGSFARKSYALATDPRIMNASLEGVPAMMERMKAMEADMKAADAKLPKRRRYADLSAAERAELARLTGLDQRALREGLARAEDKRTDTDTE